MLASHGSLWQSNAVGLCWGLADKEQFCKYCIRDSRLEHFETFILSVWMPPQSYKSVFQRCSIAGGESLETRGSFFSGRATANGCLESGLVKNGRFQPHTSKASPVIQTRFSALLNSGWGIARDSGLVFRRPSNREWLLIKWDCEK